MIEDELKYIEKSLDVIVWKYDKYQAPKTFHMIVDLKKTFSSSSILP